MTAEWKPIPSVPSYEASSDGRIRRGRRVLAQHTHRSTRAAYRRVEVWIKGRKLWRRVHRLICEAFHGEPERGAHARHMDGNAFNNRADNLQWGTARQNYMDQVRNGTAFLPPGKTNGRHPIHAARHPSPTVHGEGG